MVDNNWFLGELIMMFDVVVIYLDVIDVNSLL